MTTKILRFSIFPSNPYGHGGEKRTAQISNILNEIGIEFEIVPKNLEKPGFNFRNFKKTLILLRVFLQVIVKTGWKCNFRKFYRTFNYVSQFKGIPDSSEVKNYSIMLFEASRMEYSFIIPLFKGYGLKVIAMPHNIESLVPGLRSGLTNKPSPDWLIEEIKMLRECDRVYSISREDTLLLKQMGVKAEYLPYYPSEEFMGYLLRIRNARVERFRDLTDEVKILMLGSAINFPTKEGMIDRIEFFLKYKSEISFNLIIAGYGTEQFRSKYGKESTIQFLGELTRSQLEDRLIETDLLLVHQPPTSGALTKIVESQIAGVPIAANFVSCRNYFGTHGIFIYYDDYQLLTYLRTSIFKMPELPTKPVYELNMFKGALLNSLKR